MSDQLRNLVNNLSSPAAPKNDTPTSGGFLKQHRVTAPVPQSIKPEPADVTPKESTPVAPVVSSRGKAKRTIEDLPAPARKVYRPDVDPSQYAVKAIERNVKYYNKEIVKWLGDFSVDNQAEGGEAITQSILIETLLGIAYYDLDLQPMGFKSTQEIRQYILQKLKEY